MRRTVSGVILACQILLLTACSSIPALSVTQEVPGGPLRECLDLPLAVPPTTNGELLEGYITAREGHETCRGVVQGVLDNYGPGAHTKEQK